MRAKEDFRSRSNEIETGRRKARTTVLKQKLGTVYGTSVSSKLCVSVNSSIVVL